MCFLVALIGLLLCVVLLVYFYHNKSLCCSFAPPWWIICRWWWKYPMFWPHMNANPLGPKSLILVALGLFKQGWFLHFYNMTVQGRFQLDCGDWSHTQEDMPHRPSNILNMNFNSIGIILVSCGCLDFCWFLCFIVVKIGCQKGQKHNFLLLWQWDAAWAKSVTRVLDQCCYLPNGVTSLRK